MQFQEDGITSIGFSLQQDPRVKQHSPQWQDFLLSDIVSDLDCAIQTNLLDKHPVTALFRGKLLPYLSHFTPDVISTFKKG